MKISGVALKKERSSISAYYRTRKAAFRLNTRQVTLACFFFFFFSSVNSFSLPLFFFFLDLVFMVAWFLSQGLKIKDRAFVHGLTPYLGLTQLPPLPPPGGLLCVFFFFSKVTDTFWGRRPPPPPEGGGVGAGQAPKAPEKIFEGLFT